MNTKDKEESLTLEILEAIDESSDVTQRRLARRMNVALGLANSYLKRCVRKGLIKIHEAPANRYLYYLTPKGFAEKSRLTAQYFSISFSFYRKAGDSCREVFAECERRQWRRVLVCGVSDLAEIASLRALEQQVDIVGIYDPNSAQSVLLGKRVERSLSDCAPFDVCLITDLSDPQAAYEQLVQDVAAERIVAPGILGLAQNNTG